MLFILDDVNYNHDLIGFFIALCLAITIAILIVSLNLCFGKNKPSSNKLSIYECGFDAFQDARSFFDIRFYIVGLLFIIFDLEIFYLFPWVKNFLLLPLTGFFSMFIFLIILTFGFIYEWQRGALEWE